ncbi:MAG: DUF3500 domain-containing protein [Microbacteriaceae bacterium]
MTESSPHAQLIPVADQRHHRSVLRRAIGALAALAVAGALAAGASAPPASASPSGSGERTSASTTTSDGGGAEKRGSAPAAPTAIVSARALLASLSPSQLRSALAPESDGLLLGSLDASQREQLMATLRALLSPEAYAELTSVMEADDALDRAAGGDTPFAVDRYSLVVIGDIAGGSAFLQFGGVHLVINAIWADGELTTVEPDFPSV